MMNLQVVGALSILAVLSAACSGSDASGVDSGGAMNAPTAGGAGVSGNTNSAGAKADAGSANVEGGSGGAATQAGAGGSSNVGGSAGSSAGSSNAAPPSTRQSAKPLGAGNSSPNGYFEYLPPGYDGSSPAPLLVFWHGIGEDGNGGTELQKVTAHGPPGLIAKDSWDNARPFIVLSPQYTNPNGEIAAGGGCPSSAVIDAFLKWAIAHYEVDAKRVYLTGLSCGAIGSWDYLAEHHGSLVAAAVLLSGNPGDPTQAGSAWKRGGCALGESAIWSAHGDKDNVVPFAPDHDTLTSLMACPAPPRRAATFTTVVNGGHDIWDSFYDLSAGYGDIYSWLLSNAKP